MSDVAKTPREELECEKKYLYEYSMFFECNDGSKCQILEDDVCELLNEQQATISALKEDNEQLKNELRKEKSLREYSDSMYGADLIVNIRFSNGEWKADVSVSDDE